MSAHTLRETIKLVSEARQKMGGHVGLSTQLMVDKDGGVDTAGALELCACVGATLLACNQSHFPQLR